MNWWINMTAFNPQEITLSERQVEAIAYIEQSYMLEQQVPTADKLSDVFGVSKSTAKKWLESEKFQYILEHKGIVIKRKTSNMLTSNQLMIAEMLLNINDRRSPREKCLEAGITIQKLNTWQRDPQFNEYMQRRAEQLFENADAKAYMNVIKNIENGDLRAAQFYFEMSGKYRSSDHKEINIDGFLVTLIEILQARVKDPLVLNQIAQDIDNLMNGKPVELQPAIVAIPVASIESNNTVTKMEPAISLDLRRIDGNG